MDTGTRCWRSVRSMRARRATKRQCEGQLGSGAEAFWLLLPLRERLEPVVSGKHSSELQMMKFWLPIHPRRLCKKTPSLLFAPVQVGMPNCVEFAAHATMTWLLASQCPWGAATLQIWWRWLRTNVFGVPSSFSPGFSERVGCVMCHRFSVSSCITWWSLGFESNVRLLQPGKRCSMPWLCKLLKHVKPRMRPLSSLLTWRLVQIRGFRSQRMQPTASLSKPLQPARVNALLDNSCPGQLPSCCLQTQSSIWCWPRCIPTQTLTWPRLSCEKGKCCREVGRPAGSWMSTSASVQYTVSLKSSLLQRRVLAGTTVSTIAAVNDVPSAAVFR